MHHSQATTYMCPSANGIHSLPVELLTRIFTLGAGFDYPYDESPFLLKPNQDSYPPPSSFQLLVSHICQRWRHIALRIPSLWMILHLREPVHIARTRAYIERCSASSNYLLDILVDTVAAEDHIPGVTLCREEIVEVFELIIPHVKHWRSFHLKIRDNECKLQARHYLSTCGPAPSLETLQLYHFEDYGTAQNLWLATYRPPVVCFSNSVPKLRNVSLIGVNLPWLKSPYLTNLHKLELALHPDNIRPPYDSWERMLRQSPQLQSLYLHYSGPRAESVGEPNSAWTSEKDGKGKIVLDRLVDLKLTDLDPDYLCGVLERLYLPSVRKMAWDLPEQDFSPFIELLTATDGGGLAGRANGVTAGAISTAVVPAVPSCGEANGDTTTTTTNAMAAKKRSKISISSLLSDMGDNSNFDSEPPDASGTCASLSTVDLVLEGPLPHLSRLETLVVTALECSRRNWQTLLQCLDGLKYLEIDFNRVGAMFWKIFAGMVEVDRNGVVKAAPLVDRKKVLLPNLKTLKISGVSGADLIKEMSRRALPARVGGGLNLWVVKWSPAMRGEDTILDNLVDEGVYIPSDMEDCKISVDTFCEDEEEEAEEEVEGADEPDLDGA